MQCCSRSEWTVKRSSSVCYVSTPDVEVSVTTCNVTHCLLSQVPVWSNSCCILWILFLCACRLCLNSLHCSTNQQVCEDDFWRQTYVWGGAMDWLVNTCSAERSINSDATESPQGSHAHLTTLVWTIPSEVGLCNFTYCPAVTMLASFPVLMDFVGC